MFQFDSIILSSFSIAQNEAIKAKNSELAPVHMLLGLIKNKSTYVSRVFQKDLASVEQLLSSVPQLSHEPNLDNLRPNSALMKWFTAASAHSAEQGHSEIKESDLVKFLPQTFPSLNLDYSLLNEEHSDNEVPSFLVNLNEKAQQGKLDPVIGRTKEIRAVMEILGRRSKNNPVLVGPAGVGKTAIVEGLAEQIIKGNVPDILAGKVVYSLDLGSLMAGTKYRGDFEEKMQKLIKFITGQNGQAILFIDEIHQLVGAGRTEGAMDAANLLKPALARGELHAIGATTPEEFQKYILNDSALERRFRSVVVNEPTKEDSIEILMGVREKHEMHHGIRISEDAITAAVYLSDQYMTDKNLPDKAIDLIDEAASALKLSAQAMPRELEELQADIRSKSVLSQVEKDNEDLKKEIEQLEARFQEQKQKWESEVTALIKVSELKNRYEKLQKDLERSEREQNYEEASKIKYSLLPELEKQLQSVEHNWILSREHIAKIISRQSGIPVEKVLQSKQDHILKLYPYLCSRVYGQEEVLKEISETLITSHAGLSDESRPLGSFLLLGPTGVGKTETAKALAEFLFENPDQIIRVDLSEYSEKHSVAKLIGAPAGYVGYEEGGILTEAVRRKPYSIVLFDEVEKAHRDFSDILLQILDDGRLTDNKGRVINFKNTIIFMTSNSKDPTRDFKPEVLGRLDCQLTYQALGAEVMQQLIAKQCEIFNERLRSKKIKVQLSESLVSILAERGYDSVYGARPLNTVFNKLVIRYFSKELLKGEMAAGTYLIDWKDSNLKMTRL